MAVFYRELMLADDIFPHCDVQINLLTKLVAVIKNIIFYDVLHLTLNTRLMIKAAVIQDA